MRPWFRGRRGALAGFLAVAALVAGGLAWVTAAALDLEQDQARGRQAADEAARLRLALWRLDGRVFPVLAREGGRPYHHYCAVSPPPGLLGPTGQPLTPGAVLEPSPLLDESLPDWIRLHFQVAGEPGKEGPVAFSPQVISPALRARLTGARKDVPLTNVTPDRAAALARLCPRLQPAELLARIARQQELRATVPGAGPAPCNTALVLDPTNPPSQTMANNSNPPAYTGRGAYPNQAPMQGQAGGAPQNDTEYNRRLDQQVAQTPPQRLQREAQWVYPEAGLSRGLLGNGELWLRPGANNRHPSSRQVVVEYSGMAACWLPDAEGTGPSLIVVRRVDLEDWPLIQGILIDWDQLRAALLADVADLFPGANLVPVREDMPPHTERTMAALPIELAAEPAPFEGPAGWTPLRIGLGLAWLAALVALAAVGLGGWSLLDLSERRMRFVSAVTHELRTPLTTLRLYLDMLTSGMVREEARKEEYLRTLHVEAERLHRLIANVLDFARLENHRTRPEKGSVAVADLLAQVQAAWAERCREAGKELVVEDRTTPGARCVTDAGLVQQILGNLVDNACKYTREAQDPRIWLRAEPDDGGLSLEVEDRGPGVPARERRAVFRPFHRGRHPDVTVGGVGLGLALAHRWAWLLGGRLGLRPAPAGACFRLELPGGR